MAIPNPTTGIGVATNVVLTGTGVVPIVPKIAGTQGVAQYSVSVPIGGSVQVTALPYDDAGNLVAVPNVVVTSPASTGLLTEQNFAVLGKSAVTGSTGAGSVVTGGNVGLDAAYSGITNFPPSSVTAPGVLEATTAGGLIVANPAATLQAQTDLAADIITYTAMTATQSGLGNLSANDGGGGVGVYHAGVFKGATSLDIPTTITLDAQGNKNALFVFVAGSTITLESGAQIVLANGAQAGNVFWINGTSFTSVWNGIQSDMVGNILAHTSITLGGGTLNGRALANTGAVTMATTEIINVSTLLPNTETIPGPPYPNNAIILASAPISVPAWYRPSNQGKSYSNVYMAPAVVDDNDSNPWTVRGRFAGQTVIDFQIPTFENTEGQSLIDINRVYDETYIDTIFAQLIVTVTGGSS
jgi:hypothetical protein